MSEIFADPRDWKALRGLLDERREAKLIAEQNRERAQKRYLELEAQAARINHEAADGDPVEMDLNVLMAQRTQLNDELNRQREAVGEQRRRIQRHEESLREAENYNKKIDKARNNAVGQTPRVVRLGRRQTIP